jgi:hypothetical protein
MRDARQTQLEKLSHGHPDDELIHALEPDQVVAVASRPLPRYQLSSADNVALWLLRIFVLLITALVVYTFIIALP